MMIEFAYDIHTQRSQLAALDAAGCGCGVNPAIDWEWDTLLSGISLGTAEFPVYFGPAFDNPHVIGSCPLAEPVTVSITCAQCGALPGQPCLTVSGMLLTRRGVSRVHYSRRMLE